MSDEDKLNDRIDTIASDVIIRGEVGKSIAEGKLVLLAVFLYRPEDDTLVFCRGLRMPKEEIDAMLRKFDFPGRAVLDPKHGDGNE